MFRFANHMHDKVSQRDHYIQDWSDSVTNLITNKRVILFS